MKKALLVTLIGLCAATVSVPSFASAATPAAATPLSDTGNVTFTGTIQVPTIPYVVSDASQQATLTSGKNTQNGTVSFGDKLIQEKSYQTSVTFVPATLLDLSAAQVLLQNGKKLTFSLTQAGNKVTSDAIYKLSDFNGGTGSTGTLKIGKQTTTPNKINVIYPVTLSTGDSVGQFKVTFIYTATYA
jgi:hypothetical protein